MFVTNLPVERAARAADPPQSFPAPQLRDGRQRTPLLALADAAALATCFILAMAATNELAFSIADSRRFAMSFLTAGAGILCLLAARMHYASRLPLWMEGEQLSIVTALAALFCIGMELPLQRVAILWVCLVWLPFPPLALALRALLRRMLAARGLWQIRTILVGRPDATEQITTALMSEPSLGYDIVAVLPANTPALLRKNIYWRDILANFQASLIILAGDPSAALGADRVQSLVREGVPFAVMPEPAGLPVAGFAPTSFVSHDAVLISYRNNLAQPMSRALKMAFDLFAASIGLLCALPVLVVIALLVKLDGGPVFYSHKRLGAGGRSFGCLKFRSMRTDAGAVLEQLLATDPAARAEWSRTHKFARDPRITRLGRVLRATSLDELPQLLNVLRLEMSLVGPRPIVAAEVHHYGEDIAYYYETRPGLTGLWQISGRTETTYARRVQLDSWYVRNWSIWHDLAILAQTLPAVLKRTGAV